MNIMHAHGIGFCHHAERMRGEQQIRNRAATPQQHCAGAIESPLQKVALGQRPG